MATVVGPGRNFIVQAAFDGLSKVERAGKKASAPAPRREAAKKALAVAEKKAAPKKKARGAA